MSTIEHLAHALKEVVGDQLKRSFNGQEIWRDDRTWAELSGAVSRVLARDVVLLDRAEYRRLVTESARLKVIQDCIEEYKRRLPKDQRKKETKGSAIARWAAEHMK